MTLPANVPARALQLPVTGIRSFLFQRSDTHKHRGIDIAAPEGTPLYAVADGIIERASGAFAPGFSGYGAHVVIRHEHACGSNLPAWTLYSHMQDVAVHPLQHVSRGQFIGTVGRTKFTRENPTALFNESGAHLHFEVSPSRYPQDSEAPRLDPVVWLKSRGAHPLVSAPVQYDADNRAHLASDAVNASSAPSSSSSNGGAAEVDRPFPELLECSACLAAVRFSLLPSELEAVRVLAAVSAENLRDVAHVLSRLQSAAVATASKDSPLRVLGVAVELLDQLASITPQNG